MKHQLIDLAAISSRMPRSKFEPEVLERLADSILENEGLIQPLVLKIAGQEKYEVADRHLEYWAAVRAREKDPRRGEMINAFVVAPSSTEAVARQLAILGAPKPPSSPPAAREERFQEQMKMKDLEAAIAELVRSALKNEFANFIPVINDRLEGMENSLLARLSALEESLSAAKKAKPKPAVPEEPFTKAKLEKITVNVLREIIKDKEIPATGLKLKADLIDAILTFTGADQKRA